MAFPYPHYYTPSSAAQKAAEHLMTIVEQYMSAHPESELHRCGKMFGVLIAKDANANTHYLYAFSAMLDGSFFHPGFVEPVYAYDPKTIIGKNKEESRQLQTDLFSHYNLLNAKGETTNIVDLFSVTPAILSREDYFAALRPLLCRSSLPPTGAGDCCAPKLLQAAYRRKWHPVDMAEFWMGASPRNEIRHHRSFYPACLAKCKPLLQYMLQGVEVDTNPLVTRGKQIATEVKIIWQDDYLLAAYKPSGLLTVKGKDEQYSLQEHLNTILSCSEPLRAVHRLDMDTSGIVLLAKNIECYKLMQQQFEQCKVKKEYLALLSSSLRTDQPLSGQITLPLLPNPYDRPRQIVDYEHGKRAVTDYQIIRYEEQRKSYLVRFMPQTGRTHQLRVHAAHKDGLDMPILGDNLYGKNHYDNILCLHASKLKFVHPISNQHICISLLPEWK